MKSVIENLTPEEITNLKDAIYMIADATSKISDINKNMKANNRWRGQGDIGAIVSSLNELTENHAGGIGGLLKIL